MRYKVISPQHRVFGASAGEFIEVSLSVGQERALIGAGHIVRAPKRNRPKKAVVLMKEKGDA